MVIKRDIFGFNRVINPNDIINDSSLIYMSQEDIDADNIVNRERMEDGDNMIVFQNTVEPHQNERYCYIKYHIFVGGDGNTKLIRVDKIIVDENLINPILFSQFFTIFLGQEDSDYPNRIEVTNRYNERYRGRIVEVANVIANLICELYNAFTNENQRSYIIP